MLIDETYWESVPQFIALAKPPFSRLQGESQQQLSYLLERPSIGFQLEVGGRSYVQFAAETSNMECRVASY
jgi:hypothetical protein